MAKSRKAGVVNSYAAIKAAQRAGQARAPAAPAPAPSTNGPADLKTLGAAISHTAVPARQLIECYECGYKFQLHGRAESTNCSKCRAVLDLTDHTIAGKWTKSFKTAGTIRLAETGVLESGDLVANDIILAGTIEAGTVRAMRRLELHPGARFSEHNLSAPDLLVATGAALVFLEPARYRNVEIAGNLRATMEVTGVVRICATGCFEGHLTAGHLLVEDGGGLRASLRIESAPRQS
jgi:cytoskeletal protein CcmA (bactofilin family)